MQIGKKDIAWNYAATFLKIGSSFILLPFILKTFPSEKVGIWTVFMSIVAFSQLLDFGFNSSFTRNVTYIFSGVKKLKVKGFETIEENDNRIDYGLLKGLISSMRWYYSRIAVAFFIILITVGTFYISKLLIDYQYEKPEIYISWFILCVVSSFNLYTFYYDSLLQGKGLIKRSKQIIIIANISYFIFAVLLIFCGFGLIAIVSAQALSVLIIRVLSYRSFYTIELKQQLNSVKEFPRKEIIKAIYPNAVKIGLTIVGGFLIQKSSIFIGSMYLSLSEIASYGISMSLIGVIAGLAGIVINTYQPKITQLRVENNYIEIRKIYFKGIIFLFLTYVLSGSCLLLLGDWALELFGSQTKLMPFFVLLIAIIASLDQANLTMSGNIIVTKNEVPFYKASLLSGVFIVICLFLSFRYLQLGLLSMVLIPLLVNLAYQSWKWPYEVIKDIFLKR